MHHSGTKGEEDDRLTPKEQVKIIPLGQPGTLVANDESFSFFQFHTVYTAEKSSEVAINCGR